MLTFYLDMDRLGLKQYRFCSNRYVSYENYIHEGMTIKSV
jgi:hypothetical protein